MVLSWLRDPYPECWGEGSSVPFKGWVNGVSSVPGDDRMILWNAHWPEYPVLLESVLFEMYIPANLVSALLEA